MDCHQRGANSQPRVQQTDIQTVMCDTTRPIRNSTSRQIKIFELNGTGVVGHRHAEGHVSFSFSKNKLGTEVVMFQ